MLPSATEVMAKKLQLSYKEIESRLESFKTKVVPASEVGYEILKAFGKSEKDVSRYKEGKGILKTFDGLLIKGLFCYQAIGEAFGAKLTNLSEVYHGVATPCTQFGNDVIFDGLDKRIEIGRYHSWVVDRSGFPDCLDVTAVSDDGCIMGLKHKNYDIHGIQFHPESVLTPDGKKMVRNWLEKA